MSASYPAVLDTVIQHALSFPQNGVCVIENSTRYYVYVAIGLLTSPADIVAQNTAFIPPYQTKTFRVNVRYRTPAISLVPTNIPFQFSGTISNSPDVIRINESPDLKNESAASSEFSGLAADYVIIAGGRVQANQYGLFMQDNSQTPALAVVGTDTLWDGQSLAPGSFMIGPYFSQSKGLYWDAAAKKLTVRGDVFVTGGAAENVVSLFGTWRVTGQNTFQILNGRALLTSGAQRVIFNYSSPSLSGTRYVCIDVTKLSQQVTLFTSALSVVYPYRLVAVFQPSTLAGERGSLWLAGGGGALGASSLAVTQLSALTADVGSLTAGTLTGLTIRTDSNAIPQVQMDVDGLHLLADQAAWLEWLNSSGQPTGWVWGFDVSPGQTRKGLVIEANPQGGDIGGELNLISHAPSAYPNRRAVVQLISSNTNVRASLYAQDGTANTQYVVAQSNGVLISSNPNTSFGGLKVGGGDRTVTTALDVEGSTHFNGDVWLDGKIGGSTARMTRVARGSVQTIPNNTQTQVVFEAALYDSQSGFSLTYPARITATAAGVYLITATVIFAANNVGRRSAVLRLNGTTLIGQQTVSAVDTVGTAVNVSTIINVNTNDWFELWVAQSSGNNLDLSPISNLAPVLVAVRLV